MRPEGRPADRSAQPSGRPAASRCGIAVADREDRADAIQSGAFHAPVRLALLEVRFGSLHRILLADGERREELLSVITCTSQDAETQAYFLHICGTILRIVGPNPSLHDIVQVVRRLVELFRRPSRPASRSINGLLGELFLIAASRDVRTSTAAWRSTDIDRFDFSIGNVRLDGFERPAAHASSVCRAMPASSWNGGVVGLTFH
ncbi:PD-(D/E)XK motif protein [Mesorhizobium sp. CC13]|uniref:PD-(D/E)XK motif protein n=1 Tax=Mesorhizobium sp. CC13 TaxID=3029194 RepID=UPI0032651938